MTSKNHERAIEAAKEYRRESQHGDVVRAEQVRLTIESNLVRAPAGVRDEVARALAKIQIVRSGT